MIQYSKLQKKYKIGGFIISDAYFIYTQSNENYRSKLFVEEINGKKLYISSQEKINRLSLSGNCLVYVSRNESITRLINLESLLETSILVEFNFLFPITSSIYNNKYYSITENKVEKNIYDLCTGEIVNTIEPEIEGYINVNSERFIVTKKNTNLFFYKKNTYSLLWQKDLSKETDYTDWDGEHKGEITNIYSYNNQLIVLSGDCILALAIDTGEILWKITYKDFAPYTLHIVDDKGYLAKGVFYSVIDLDKGKKILNTEIDNPFDREDENQNSYGMVGSDITYHQGKIYFSDKQKNGKYYLFCLNPEIGIIEDYLFLEGIDSNLAPPKFHKDKMFLLDSKSNLHIFKNDTKMLIS